MNRNRITDMRLSPTLVSLFCLRLTNQLRSRLRAIYAILPGPLFAVARHPPPLRILSPLTAGLAKPVMGHDQINIILTLRNWLNLLLRFHISTEF